MSRWPLCNVLFLIGLNITSFSAYANNVDQLPTNLQLFWSKPIIVNSEEIAEVGKADIPAKQTGITLQDGGMTSGGHVFFLGSLFDPVSYKNVLFENAEQSGPEGAIDLALHGAAATFVSRILGWNISAHPTVTSVTASGNDAIWVGGATNQYMGIASDSHSDAYLAKLNGSGIPIKRLRMLAT